MRTTNHNYLKESSGMTGMGQGRKRPAVSARTTFHGCCYSVSCEAVPQGKSVIGLSVTANRRVMQDNIFLHEVVPNSPSKKSSIGSLENFRDLDSRFRTSGGLKPWWHCKSWSTKNRMNQATKDWCFQEASFARP